MIAGIENLPGKKKSEKILSRIHIALKKVDLRIHIAFKKAE